MTHLPLLESLLQDLRFSIRTLRKNVVFVVIAIVTLALGIGANTALFSVINAVLLRPLPYNDGGRLVWIWSVNPKGALKQRVSNPDFLDWQRQTQTLECCAGWNGYEPVLTGAGEPERLQGVLTMGNLFTLLGVAPMLGTITEAEKQRPQEPGVVLSFSLWQRTFNSDPNVVGRRINLDGSPYTVAGVMPAGFQFPIQAVPPADLWVRVERFNPALEKRRDARLIEVLGRLKPGVTLAQAQAELDVIASNLSAQYPETNKDFRVRVVPAMEEVTQGVSVILLTLFGAVACLLLIACVNVINLQLARAVSRHDEIMVRALIGATPSRIGRQLVIESLLVGIAGGVAGGLLAFWGLDILRTQLPAGIPRINEIGVDLRVLAFTTMTCLAAGLTFGLAPAWYAARIHPTMPKGYTTTVPRSGKRLSSVLVAAEIALAMILLAGAGLFTKSLWLLNQTDPGFNPRNVLTFRVSLPSQQYRNPQEGFREIQARLQAIPGVQTASAGLQLPDRGGPILNDVSPFFDIEGRPPSPSDRPRATMLTVQPGYFRAMGIPLVNGRDFSETDRAGTPRAIVINQTLARTYFSGEDPLGKRLKLDSWVLPGQPAPEIVGIASDVKHAGLAAVQPLVYVTIEQFPRWGSYIVVKTDDDPLKFVSAVRGAVRFFDKDLPIGDIQTLERRIGESLGRERFIAVLLSIFSALALTLAAVGLYGILSYVTAQRTREIGVRIALGAQIGALINSIVSQGMKLVIIGAAIGLGGALALARLVGSLLFGVSSTDPFAFAFAMLTLLAIGALASWIPARRAAKVDPIEALRYQ